MRGYDYEMGFSDAVKLMLLSFDSTVKANLSVGFPLDLHIYKADSFKEGKIKRIEADNKYYSKISNGWSKALKSAFDSMPNFPIEWWQIGCVFYQLKKIKNHYIIFF